VAFISKHSGVLHDEQSNCQQLKEDVVSWTYMSTFQCQEVDKHITRPYKNMLLCIREYVLFVLFNAMLIQNK